VSVVTAIIKTTKGKLMSYKFDPTVKELREAFEVAYGEYGVYSLVGVLFANVPKEEIERIYRDTLDTINADLKKKGLV
jgi:hypothetical protein